MVLIFFRINLACYDKISLTLRWLSNLCVKLGSLNVDKQAANAELKPGDKVQLQFSDLVNPAEKLSGAYNFNASIYYKAEDDTMFRSLPGSPFGVYDFSGNPVRQLIEITIPEDWEGGSYSLVAGAIKMGGFGTFKPGYHRGITYATGLNPNFNAPTSAMILSHMPELSIPVANAEYEANRPAAEKVEKMIDAIGEVTLGSKSAINAARAAYKELTAAQQELVNALGAWRNYSPKTSAPVLGFCSESGALLPLPPM
mgnify:CR=1 FL=1